MMAVVGSLRQQRFLTAVRIKYPECVEEVSRSLWYRGWCEDMDVSKDNSLTMIGRRAGLRAEETKECIEVNDDKQELNSLETSCDNLGGKVKKNDMPRLRRKTKQIKNHEKLLTFVKM
jgi:predicted DsbA family dithiol-disulfide isomerase